MPGQDTAGNVTPAQKPSFDIAMHLCVYINTKVQAFCVMGVHLYC